MKAACLLGALLFAAACGNSGARSTGGGRTGAGATAQTGLQGWETVRSVLQNPRCQNCHPADDVPRQGDDGHPHTMRIERGVDGFGMAGARCSTCHQLSNPPDSYGPHTPPGNPKGWHMPPPELKMVFIGRTSHELCEQLKDPARNGHKDMAALRTHLDDPLVTWGWAPGFQRAPVPTPHADFVAAFEAWRDAGAPCP